MYRNPIISYLSACINKKESKFMKKNILKIMDLTKLGEILLSIANAMQSMYYMYY